MTEIHQAESALRLHTGPGTGRQPLAELVRDMHARRSVRALFRTNLFLLTRKIAERNARAGGPEKATGRIPA